MVLLHALARSCLRLALRVAHIHHGLRGRSADRDAALVVAAADRYGLPVSVTRLVAETRPRGTSVQVWAREARYADTGGDPETGAGRLGADGAYAERPSGDGAPESATRHRRARPSGDSRGTRPRSTPAAGCLAGGDRRLCRAATGRLPRRPVKPVGRVPAESDPTSTPPAACAGVQPADCRDACRAGYARAGGRRGAHVGGVGQRPGRHAASAAVRSACAETSCERRREAWRGAFSPWPSGGQPARDTASPAGISARSCTRQRKEGPSLFRAACRSGRRRRISGSGRRRSRGGRVGKTETPRPPAWCARRPCGSAGGRAGMAGGAWSACDA